MRLTSKLLGYLNRVFDKNPQAFLALRLSYAGPMTWRIADAVLTTAVSSGPGTNLQVDLRRHTIASLVSFLSAQPGYSVLYQVGADQSGLGARALIDGAGDIDQSNGDHLDAHSSPLWSYIDAMSEELTAVRAAIVQMLRQMSTRTANDVWLDELGSYYNVPRLALEPDERYSSRIITEVLRPRMNNVAIERAIEDFTGQVAKVTNVVLFSDTFPLYSGSINHTGYPYYYNANAKPIYGLFDVEYGYDLLNGGSITQFGTQVRALVGRLRAAGTQLRALNLIGSRIIDTFTPPTEQMALTVSADINEAFTAPTEGAMQMDVAMAGMADTASAADEGISLTLYYGQTYSGLRKHDQTITHRGGTTVREWIADPSAEGFLYLPSLGLNLLSGQLDPRVTFSRSTSGWCFDPSGTFAEVPAGMPRFDYDPVSKACKGLLVEGARTNVLAASESSAWTSNTPNTSYPGYFAGAVGTMIINGSVSGDSPSKTAAAGTVWPAGTAVCGSAVFDLASTTGTSLTVLCLNFDADGAHSFLVTRTNAGVLSISKNGANATAVSMGAENLWGTVWRIWVSGTFSKASTSAPRIYAFANGGTLPQVIAGLPQLEAGTAPSSYIPTTAGAVTRAADQAYMLVSGFGYNATAGTLLVDAAPACAPIDAAVRMAAAFYPPSGDGAVRLEQINASARMVGRRSDDGTFVADGPAWTAGVARRLVGYYDASTLGLVVDGTPVANVSPLGPIGGVVRLGIGSNGLGGNYLGGWVRRLAYYPRVLLSDERIAISS